MEKQIAEKYIVQSCKANSASTVEMMVRLVTSKYYFYACFKKFMSTCDKIMINLMKCMICLKKTDKMTFLTVTIQIALTAQLTTHAIHLAYQIT